MNKKQLWQRYKKHLCVADTIGLRLDISRMNFDETFLEQQGDSIAGALAAMDRLERGAIANADENRMVGHYWLRAPELAPDPKITSEIREAHAAINGFVEKVHTSQIKPERGDGFYIVLIIGIGGSVLGPQFVADALGMSDDPMMVRFLDNTDPDGIDRILAELDEALQETLTIVISKSGGTVETRNALAEVEHAYKNAGLNFAKHAVAVTSEGSVLHQKARREGWVGVFPMWDWVGGRTSELSSVGLLPAALQGININEMITGARMCDEVTRSHTVSENPAALLALMWKYMTEVRGRRLMVVLPYRDRLGLLGRYLQQLVMESLGKERDRDGNVVNQGLTVYGNKGSTDQHAYVQQLRDGTNDFFATFLEVGRDRNADSIRVEEEVTCGDYLSGFLRGTRDALYEKGRESITISLEDLTPRSVGALIALFERAVGLYAELINVNAYHQPGVEAGKCAAEAVIDLQRRILGHLRSSAGTKLTVDEIAAAIGKDDDTENVFHVLEHAATNPDHGIVREQGTDAFSARYFHP